MKLFAVLFTLIIALLLFSCEDDQQHASSSKKDLMGEVISHSDCKSFKAGTSGDTISDSMSCVKYEFIKSTNTLNLKHINAGFNCCPDSLYCTITLSGDTIIIEEHELQALCDCNCLFDLDIELNNCNAKRYEIKFIEPYSHSQKPLCFSIDLSTEPSGSHCLKRTEYPWGMYRK